jgi:hypothetical protein
VNIFVNRIFSQQFSRIWKSKFRKKFLENVKRRHFRSTLRTTSCLLFCCYVGVVRCVLTTEQYPAPTAQCLMASKHWYFFNIAGLGSFIQSAKQIYHKEPLLLENFGIHMRIYM